MTKKEILEKQLEMLLKKEKKLKSDIKEIRECIDYTRLEIEIERGKKK